MQKVDLTKFIPLDKSEAIRQYLFSLLTMEKVEVQTTYPAPFDISAAFEALPLFGKNIVTKKNTAVITGTALKPIRVVDCRNSATMLHLLMGISIFKGWKVLFTGDSSLLKRDHLDFVKAAKLYGAEIVVDNDVITVIPSSEIPAVETVLSKQSAQLKGFHLLCMLKSGGKLLCRNITRKNTENLLSVMGADISESDDSFKIAPAQDLKGYSLPLYKDPSSAFIAASSALIAGFNFKISSLTPESLRMTPFELLNLCGAFVKTTKKDSGFTIESKRLPLLTNDSLSISESKIPSIIDEIPFLAYMSVRSGNPFIISDGQWLRNKESDRVDGTIKRIGKIYEASDFQSGFAVIPELKTETSFSLPHSDDHRMEMLSAVIALDRNISFKPNNSISVSFPQFSKMIQFLKEKCSSDATQSINRHRKKLDIIDKKIAALLAERVDIASEIIGIKKRSGIEISDTQRENSIILKLSKNNNSISGLINDIYRRIFDWIKHRD
jgi:5-enolpyruvylshikimate-3-phosphate synthase/chorismate mutase